MRDALWVAVLSRLKSLLPETEFAFGSVWRSQMARLQNAHAPEPAAR